MSTNRRPGEFIERLTPTERLYLYRTALGQSDSMIAGQRRISTQTVRNTIFRAYRKLGVRSRVEAWAKLGWLNPVA
jgi:DNA-binding NarL/FixJ family response regulator